MDLYIEQVSWRSQLHCSEFQLLKVCSKHAVEGPDGKHMAVKETTKFLGKTIHEKKQFHENFPSPPLRFHSSKILNQPIWNFFGQHFLGRWFSDNFFSHNVFGQKFVAHNFDGKYLDCGTMSGYIKSSKEIGKI